jgi:hypothetical protein
MSKVEGMNMVEQDHPTNHQLREEDMNMVEEHYHSTNHRSEVEDIKKPSCQYLGLICNESLTCRGLNSNSGHFSCFILIFISFGESRLLVSWCAGGRCGMVDNDEDRDRSRRPGAEDQRWSHRSGTRWSDDREVG